MAIRVNNPCLACGASNVDVFYEVAGVPTNCMVLLPDEERAKRVERGDIALGVCGVCGFVSNTAFDPAKTDYSADYESSQAYSETFNVFARRLASDLIARYALHGKRVVEIGSGGSDFLAELCRGGVGRAIGIDPAAAIGPQHQDVHDRIELLKEFYEEGHGEIQADMILCRMTLEHIWDVRSFVSTVHEAAARRGVPVVFQVPDAERILTTAAFWDIYYEHCSYFTLDSLASLFASCGFDVRRVRREFHDQYLLLEALPSGRTKRAIEERPDRGAGLAQTVRLFSTRSGQRIAHWRRRLQADAQREKCNVVWGGGSKGVAFLNALGIGREVTYVVDINPLKQNKYMAGTGHLIAGPEHLRAAPPDLIIAMNPAYQHEIRQTAEAMGVRADVLTVETETQEVAP